MLGAAVALNAGEALSQEKPNKELPQKGYFPEDPAELSHYRYALLDKVVLDDDSAEAASVQSKAEEDLELVRREAGQVTTYWELSFRGLDPVSGEPIFEYVRPSLPGLKPIRECIATDHYVDTFPVRSTGQTVLVLDRKDQFDHVTCPELVAAPTKVEIKRPSEPSVPEYVPHPGKFADLEPSLVKRGIFLVPVRELGITEEVPAELTTSAYITQTDQAKGKRIVYRQYVLDNYEPKTGSIRIHDGGNMEQCVETASYQDKMLGDKTSYILSLPGSPEMKDVACKEEAASKPVAETPVKESKPWELPVRAGLSLGADMEETSPYSLGNAPALHLSAQTQPFAFPLELGLSGDFIFTGEGSGLEGLDLMVGGQPIQKVPVRAYLTIGDSFEVRERYSETALNGALSYGVLVEGDIYKFTLGNQALAVNCHASAQQHLYGGGGLSVWNPAGGCGVAWGHVVSGGGRETIEKVAEVEVPLDRIVVGTQQTYVFAPGNPLELKEFEDEQKAQVAKAEYVRISEELPKLAGRQAWPAVTRKFKDLEKCGVPIEDKYYKTVLEALELTGDISEYNRVARQLALQNSELAQSYIDKVEKNFGIVELTVSTSLPSSVSIVPVNPPFDPFLRASIDFANKQVQGAPGIYLVLLPLGDYTLLDKSVHVQTGKLVPITVQGDFSEEAANVVSPFQSKTYNFDPQLKYILSDLAPLTKPSDQMNRSALGTSLKESFTASDWNAANVYFGQIMEFNAPVSYEEFFMGGEAAYNLGHVQDAYERFLTAAGLNNSSEVQGWITKIEKNYASVTINASRNKTPILTSKGTSKNPIERESLKDAKKQLGEDKTYRGLLPVSLSYELSGYELEMKPLAEGKQTYDFTLDETTGK